MPHGPTKVIRDSDGRFVTDLGEQINIVEFISNGTLVSSIWAGTQDQYDAIAVKSDVTLYLIIS